MALPPARLLVVCTANICRSPLAARLLHDHVARTSPPGAQPLAVTSAGTRARPGLPAAAGIVAAADSWGIDLTDHVARPLTRELAEPADLVVTMEAAQRDVVARLAPGLAVRTFTLRELAGLVARAGRNGQPDLVVDAGLQGLARSLHLARRSAGLAAGDVEDPYGGSDEDYRRAALDLAHLVGVVGEPLVEALSDHRQ